MTQARTRNKAKRTAKKTACPVEYRKAAKLQEFCDYVSTDRRMMTESIARRKCVMQTNAAMKAAVEGDCRRARIQINVARLGVALANRADLFEERLDPSWPKYGATGPER